MGKAEEQVHNFELNFVWLCSSLPPDESIFRFLVPSKLFCVTVCLSKSDLTLSLNGLALLVSYNTISLVYADTLKVAQSHYNKKDNNAVYVI